MQGNLLLVLFFALILIVHGRFFNMNNPRASPEAHHEGVWSHLMGKAAEEAKQEILKEKPELKVHIVPKDAMVTMDFRDDRVRLFVDEHGKVIRPPRLG